MNRIAKARRTLQFDLARVASIVRNHGAAMGMYASTRDDFLRRCAAIARFAEEDFDATQIGESVAPVMPHDADEDDDVIQMFDQDEFSTVQESEGIFEDNMTLDRTARRIARTVAQDYIWGR